MLGIVGMVAIANLQYGWTLFVNPIDSKFHWGKAAIQVAFTLFVLAETWLVPFEGYLVDRFGPRWLVAVGGILGGVAWWPNAEPRSLFAPPVRGSAIGPGFHAARNVEDSGVLALVRDDDNARHGRFDGDRAARPDRRGL